MASLLQICCWLCEWNDFENRLIFDEVMTKIGHLFLIESLHILDGSVKLFGDRGCAEQEPGVPCCQELCDSASVQQSMTSVATFDVLAKSCHLPDFSTHCRWHRPQVARSDKRISGTPCVNRLTDFWPRGDFSFLCSVPTSRRLWLSSFSGVVSLSFVVVTAAWRTNKSPVHYYSLCD